jgi:hypothetical protein
MLLMSNRRADDPAVVPSESVVLNLSRKYLDVIFVSKTRVIKARNSNSKWL